MKRNITKILALILSATILCAMCSACASAPSASSSAASTPAASSASSASKPKPAFPERAVTVIIPAKAGGDTDTYGRIFSTALEKELGVPVTVNNYDASNVAMNDCKNADPDGYTLVFFHAAFLVSMLTGSTQNDLFNDYQIVGVPVIDSTSCVVFNGHRWKNMNEFLASAAAREQIIGTCQQGTTGHLATAMFGKALNIDWKQVESTSQADRYADMLADRVDILYCQYGLISQYLSTGDFICAGIMAEERNPFFTDAPTLKEQGYDNCSLLKPYFFAAPKGLDADALDTLNEALKKSCADETVKEALKKFYCVPEYHNVEDSIICLNNTYDAYAQFKSVLVG